MMIPILLEFKFLKNFKEILHTCLLACMYVYCVYGPEESVRFLGTGQL